MLRGYLILPLAQARSLGSCRTWPDLQSSRVSEREPSQFSAIMATMLRIVLAAGLTISILTACSSGSQVSIRESGVSQIAGDTACFELFGPSAEFAKEVLGSEVDLAWHASHFRDGEDSPAGALICELRPPDYERLSDTAFTISMWQGEMSEPTGYGIQSRSENGFGATTSSIIHVRPEQVDAIQDALNAAVKRLVP